MEKQNIKGLFLIGLFFVSHMYSSQSRPENDDWEGIHSPMSKFLKAKVDVKSFELEISVDQVGLARQSSVKFETTAKKSLSDVGGLSNSSLVDGASGTKEIAIPPHNLLSQKFTRSKHAGAGLSSSAIGSSFGGCSRAKDLESDSSEDEFVLLDDAFEQPAHVVASSEAPSSKDALLRSVGVSSKEVFKGGDVHPPHSSQPKVARSQPSCAELSLSSRLPPSATDKTIEPLTTMPKKTALPELSSQSQQMAYHQKPNAVGVS